MTVAIGFIGLGTMGGRMASWLVKSGYRVIVHDVNTAAMDVLCNAGAHPAVSAKDVADKAEVICTSLPSPKVLDHVMFGETGVIYGKAVRTVIDLSTSGPQAIQEVARRLAVSEITLIDAPVSGNPQGAGEGKLTLMVSGDEKRIAEIRSVLETLGQRVVIVGNTPGLGQYMKLVNNFLSATALAASAEAIVMGVKAGLDPDRIIEVLNNGSGKNSATLDKVPNDVLTGKFDHGFSIGLLYKDVKLYAEEADALNVPTWIGASVRQLWAQSQLLSGSGADCTRIFDLFEAWTATQVRGSNAATT
jgi:3-hydroxyisobutyrate dehydrogenase-like beta-hydroxyacid dehydrogenase